MDEKHSSELISLLGIQSVADGPYKTELGQFSGTRGSTPHFSICTPYEGPSIKYTMSRSKGGGGLRKCDSLWQGGGG